MLRIDVVKLVDHRVELRDPIVPLALIEPFLAGAVERLVAEARQRERDHVLDRTRSDRHAGRLRHEPLGSPRDTAAVAVAPEVVAGFARRQTQTVAGGEGAFGVRAPRSCKYQQVAHVDERERWHTRDDVAHQQREPFGVVDHGCAPVTTRSSALRETRVALGGGPGMNQARSEVCIVVARRECAEYNDLIFTVSSWTRRSCSRFHAASPDPPP